MLPKKDIKALHGLPENQFKFCLAILVVFALLQLFYVYHNVSLVLSYSETMGVSFKELLALWNSEPELQNQYMGYEVLAIHKLNMSVLGIGVALLLVIVSVSLSVSRSRNKRVLAALEQFGALGTSRNA